MAQEGLLFDELSDFKKDLMRKAKAKFPDEVEGFLKDEAKKVNKIAKKIAKKEVGTSKGKKKDWEEAKSYHKRFKVGKPYKYSVDLCCRAFNSAPHAHLIEYGHVKTTKKGRELQALARKDVSWTNGKFIYKDAEFEFIPQYLNDVEMFLVKTLGDYLK